LINLWKSASLRTQLVAITSILMVVAVGITGLLTISMLRQNLVNSMDQDIRNNAQAVSNYVFGISENTDSSLLRYYGALLNDSGTVLRPTVEESATQDVPNLRGLDLEAAMASRNPVPVPGTLPDSQGWRVQIFGLEESQGYMAVGLPMVTVNDPVDKTAALILTVGLASTVFASAVAYLAVTRSFRPLVRMEKTASAIANGDLSRRVEVENPATEVGRLSRSVNTMLSHIEGAFAARVESEKKMRRFVSDASHELRTPLVTIRGFSELYRHGGLQTQEDVAKAMGRIEGEATRMGQLVEDLLTLARIDEQRPLESKPVDLLVLGTDAAMDARVSAPDRQVKVIGLDGGPPRSAPTVGDEARLRQVMANLVTNALRYTPEGTPIEIAVGVEPVIDNRKDSIIEVRDHGHGISEEEASRVFERFYRADTSRTRETGGTGLGLAIVAALVAQHDGTVRILETDGGGATLSIRLPYSDADETAQSEPSLPPQPRHRPGFPQFRR
jgi:two-component system, OmpR family, sensor kinase